ncbi:tRNA (adenosine(37)-N6)-threonylcarbamoyltransferase complex ATPase subunit type 1 TsaE [Pedobacter sp. SYSU D00535]|uniref:tRNA (adenosine(37)-N6)-threonylcarbamoyltransferase complex ATPase subunit type 1 TsaE n=1 Tax=Pedobacter sp. SYSU D00535 TaxID=2810308 RepID=UPI001A9627B2|nr:tRNA (adenosine(37)-N6)-threonylcarbamoyltransferase complex ATPase subunit type 1 TsaE [Pedobacter sp. SYSU D00535]
MEYSVKSVEELEEVAAKILAQAGDEKTFLFYGPMGAGKTTFIKSLCSALGVEDAVSSPTFSIVNEYSYPKGLIYHFDFYRLKAESEALDLGFEDYLYSGEYCFIEWPEKVNSFLPERYFRISISEAGENERVLSAVLVA